MAIDWTKKTDKIDEISAEIFNKVFDSIQKEFDNIINGNTMVDRANTAQTAERADKSDTDGEGNNIVDTYATKLEVGNIETKKAMFSNGDVITLDNNKMYYSEEEISLLTINYPNGDFISSLEFTLASEGDITITLPESKYIGGVPTFANGETRELNIKNGVVVGGLIE